MHSGLGTTLHRLRARVIRTFFSNFFRLLLFAVSLSEWVIVCQLSHAVRSLPLPAHIVAPLCIFVFNRYLAQRTRQQRCNHNPAGGMPRLYYAISFTCLFCVLFLVFTDSLWVIAKVFLGALAAHAHTVHQSHVRIDSELDTAFRWLADMGMASISIAFVYGYTVGQLRLRVRRFVLPLRHQPASWNGLRIAQISDIHIGQNITRPQLERFVARVNELAPDIICITGDIADSPSAELEAFLPVLAQLHATCGVYAILGNHDHYAGADHVEAVLRRLTPFTVLRDQHTSIQVKGARLHIIGLDDHGRDWARGEVRVPYLAAALAAVPEQEPVLLLSHRPDVFPQAAAHGVALTLAGHTHGGQIGLPWFNGRTRNLAEFITAFDRGLYQRNGSSLYVNCGLGVTGQRIRLNTPREILLLEVRNATAAEDIAETMAYNVALSSLTSAPS